jgi:catechol 2,3-dioxygenase-like lactoylglutathione lyase family enzyme
MDQPKPPNKIIETGIYVQDTERTLAFYERVLGAERMSCSDRLAAINIGGNSVFLAFKKGGSIQPTQIPGGIIPGNDASGQMHFAFAITPESFDSWLDWLPTQGVEIESVVNWDRGGRSIYFRDPDGHNVELATPGIWEIY